MSLFEELKKKLESAASPEGVEQTRQFLGMPSGEEIVKRTQEGRYALNPLEALGIVGRPIESVTAAPARAAISSLQGNLDMSEAMKAFANQFGRNVDLAPTGEQIAERAGLQGKAAAAAGLGLDVAIDPSSIIGGAALKALPLLGLAGTMAKAGKAEQVGKVLAKQDPLGFYSKLEDVILSKMGKSATPEQVMSIAKGAKEEEVAVSGLAEFLKGKEKVTQEEVLQQIRENRPQISEVQKNSPRSSEVAQAREKYFDLSYEAGEIENRLQDKIKEIIPRMVKDGWTEENARRTIEQIAMSRDKTHEILSRNPIKNNYLTAEEANQLRDLNQSARDKFAEAYKYKNLSDPTRFKQWQEPGGENYREVLFTLPPKGVIKLTKENVKLVSDEFTDSGKFWLFRAPDPLYGTQLYQIPKTKYPTAEEALDYIIKTKQQPEGNPTKLFKSKHWNEPNVLAHARVNERVDETGKKLLHVEEIQSDWHQKGRTQGYLTDEQNKLIEQATKVSEKAKFDFERARVELKNSGLLNEIQDLGYDTPDQAIYAILKDPDWTKTYDLRGANEKLIPMANDLREKFKKVSESSNELVKLKSKESVPDAPFKKNWMELMAKRLIRQAVDSGADRMSWTPGAKQAARYDLSKQVKEIDYIKNSDGTYSIGIADLKGNPVSLPKDIFSPDELPDVVGKEIADKIIQGQGKKYRGHEHTTLEGIDLQIGGEGQKGFYDKMLPDFLRKFGKKYGAEVGQTTTNGMKVPFLELTPELKKAIKEEGSSLFQVGGAVTLPMLMEKMRRDREAESAP